MKISRGCTRLLGKCAFQLQGSGGTAMGVEIDRAVIAEFCRKYSIRRLAIFGSALRGELRPESDIDVLVEFREGASPSFFRLFDMEDELSSILGRKVDLLTPEDLSRYFREEVLKEAEVQYAEE